MARRALRLAWRTMSMPLRELEQVLRDFGPGAAARKLALMSRLARTPQPQAKSVLRLHELLCWMRAYPDDARVQAQAVAMLERFDRRADLRAHRAALADSGIAGTAIHYRFFHGQAQWLARHWPANLRLDRDDAEPEERIARALVPLLTPTETQALVELKPAGLAALDRVRGRDQTDAVFLLRRIAALPGNGFTREAFSDAMDAAYVLDPGPGTPSRTRAFLAGAPVVYRHAPPPHGRPDLRAEILRPPRRVQRLSSARAQAAIDLARGAMVTRARSLEAFSFADARDAWLVDDGDGLAFVLTGVVPERRHALAAFVGGLTLRNGVPIGYVQSDIVGRSAALSFNTFETFRGGEAAYTFARWLAALHHLYGTTSFSVEPYQLGGKGNDEGLVSGAWWFYVKLGFAPRDPGAQALAREELDRMARRPGHRTPQARLARMAASHVFFELDPARPHPLVPLGEIGLAAGAALSRRAGADRERAVAQLADEMARACGATSCRHFAPAAREAWRRLVTLLPLLRIERWPAAERAALLDLARAKAGRSERDFVARSLSHARLQHELQRLARRINASKFPG
jgi:hypothetical protein